MNIKKIAEALDQSQIDKTLFSKVLILQNIGFNIASKMDGNDNVLTIMPFGLSASNRAESHTINGRVTNAEIEDLNSDGFPEVLIYTTSSNGKGNVIGYSVNNGKSMSQIAFPSILDDSKLNTGYNGKDEFSIVETTLSRNFLFLKTEKPQENKTNRLQT